MDVLAVEDILEHSLENVLDGVLTVSGSHSIRVLAVHTCVVDMRIHDDEGHVAEAGASDALVAFHRACASRDQDAYSDVRRVAS